MEEFFRKEPPVMSKEEFLEKYLRPAVSELWERFISGMMTVDDRTILGSVLGYTMNESPISERES